jgi:hypothetical protein
MSDNATAAFFKFTELPLSSSEYGPLNHHVREELKQLVYKNRSEQLQSLELL